MSYEDIVRQRDDYKQQRDALSIEVGALEDRICALRKQIVCVKKRLVLYTNTVYLDFLFKDIDVTLGVQTSTRWNVANFLKSLTEEQLKELLQTVSLIIDPLGQELIKKLCEETES